MLSVLSKTSAKLATSNRGCFLFILQALAKGLSILIIPIIPNTQITPSFLIIQSSLSIQITLIIPSILIIQTIPPIPKSRLAFSPR